MHAGDGVHVHADVVGQAAGPLGTPTLETRALADVVDAELTFHKKFELLVPQSFTVGVGYRLKTIDWTYLDQFHTEHHLAIW